MVITLQIIILDRMRSGQVLFLTINLFETRHLCSLAAKKSDNSLRKGGFFGQRLERYQQTEDQHESQSHDSEYGKCDVNGTNTHQSGTTIGGGDGWRDLICLFIGRFISSLIRNVFNVVQDVVFAQ